MELLELPQNYAGLHSVHLIDWSPAAPVVPNETVLTALARKRARTSKRQSEHSRQRQNFITGMDRHLASPLELRGRNSYLEELEARMTENEWSE